MFKEAGGERLNQIRLLFKAFHNMHISRFNEVCAAHCNPQRLVIVPQPNPTEPPVSRGSIIVSLFKCRLQTGPAESLDNIAMHRETKRDLRNCDTGAACCQVAGEVILKYVMLEAFEYCTCTTLLDEIDRNALCSMKMRQTSKSLPSSPLFA